MWHSKDITVKRVTQTVTRSRSHLHEPNVIKLQIYSAFKEIMMNIDCRHLAAVPFIGWNDRPRADKPEFVIITE
jgi:hypothetical protein